MIILEQILETSIDLKKLKKILKNKRYQHSLGVAETAYQLGGLFDVELKKVVVAAILHDCAKDLTEEEADIYCTKYKIPLSKTEKSNRKLIHAKIGAVLAKEIFGVKDKEILSAISFHTTGRQAMSVLEKIIYISDFIEPGRGDNEFLAQLRRLSKKNLDATMALILKASLDFLEKTRKPIDPNTKKAYAYYNNVK